MILNNKTALEQLHLLKKSDTHDYLVYKGSHFNYLQNKARFALAINVLEFINLVIWANQLYKRFKTKKNIPVQIFYTVIEALLEERRLTKAEYAHYLHAMHKVESFKKAIIQFYVVDHFEITDDITNKIKP